MSSPDEQSLVLHPRAVTALRRGDPDSALDAVHGCGDTAARRIAGRALLMLGDRAGARQAFDAALLAADGDPGAAALAHEGLAAVARATGELSEASDHLRAALDRAPASGLHHLHREAASLAQRRGDLVAAERHAVHALATASGVDASVEAADRVRLGSVLAELGRYDESIDELARAVELLTSVHGPAHVEVVAAEAELAAALEAAGRVEEAICHQERVLAQRVEALGGDHPSLASIMLTLAALELAAGREDRARTWAEDATRILTGRVPADDPLLRRALSLV